ncbi:MAG: glycosyltransferase family A protein [Bacteroidota bacterium]
MSAPLVSVIIPVYNGERFIAEAVESVLAQTYPHVELVVVDDGSTDASASIVERYEGVRLIRQENQGDGVARNRGVEESTGELLAFLDADDRWRPEKLTLQVAYMADNPEAGHVLGQMWSFLHEGMERPSWVNPATVETAMPGVLPGTLMARRSFFDQVGPFDTSFETAADSDWLLRARQLAGAPHVIHEVVLERRIHTTNISGKAASTVEIMDLVHAWAQRKKAQASS